MRGFGSLLIFTSLAFAKPGYSDAPRVVTDIAPVHSLVSQIMDGVGEPDLLLPATVSPHDYALRPSDARVLQNADAVFWVGEALTPWLVDTLDTLTKDAANMQLLNVEGTLLLEFREGSVFAERDDDHDHDHAHDHGHDESHDHEGHDHSGLDPHAWLDPSNAKIWLAAIADELSKIDSENAETYQANLVTAQDRVDALTTAIQGEMNELSGLRFVVLHDGYRYFEDRFGMQAVGAISESDAAAPSAGRVRDIRQAIEKEEISCLFTEVQLQSPLLDAIAAETDANVVTLDPLGALLVPGTDLYEQNMMGIATSFRDCP